MKNTALLVMDYQNDILKLVESKTEALLKNAKSLIQAARSSGVPVIYIKVAFRSGYPEVSSSNKAFGNMKNSNRLILGGPGAEIHAAVAPLAGEVVVVKHRVGPFAETELPTVLRACRAEKLILLGVATSGVVLSVVRAAADLDFGIAVVSDACADADEEVHRVLMEKVFPRQADVVSAEAALLLF